MRSPRAENNHADRALSDGGALKLSGVLLLVGFVLNALVTSLFHPAGSEDDHPVIFSKYADSDGWVAIHFGQFLGILIALAGLLVLHQVLKGRGAVGVLALLAAGAAVATGALFAVLQGVDGVALKQTVEAWDSASGSEQALRYGDAETVRWTEWGVQSYFRFFLGVTLALYGTSIVGSRRIAAWLGWVAVLAGLMSVAMGIDVAYNGLASGFGDAAGLAFVIALLIFAVGILVAGRRMPDRLATTGLEQPSA